MNAILLSLGSAVTFGAADFLGGLASRKGAVLLITALSQGVGLTVILALMPLLGGELSTAAVTWGALAGVGGSVGLIAYFRALSMGAMGVTAPVASLVGAAVPLAVGLALGERPEQTATIGIVLGVAATILVSRTPAVDRGGALKSRMPVLVAGFAGVMFGIFFVALDQAPADSGLWPLVGARVAGLVILAAMIAVRRPAVPGRGVVGIASLSGLLDMLANILFLQATREGLLILTSVITGLYPVGVVILAWVFLKERLSATQLAGVGLALCATGLIAI